MTSWSTAAERALTGVVLSAIALTAGCDSVSGPTSTGTFSEVATGAQHACALTTDGKVFCWGFNASGRAGSASRSDFAWPVQVTLGPVRPSHIVAGTYASCATIPGHDALCWGGGNSLPAALAKSAGVGSLVVGDNVCGLADASTRRCWSGLSALPTDRALAVPLRMLSAAGAQLCGLAADSTAWCFDVFSDSEVAVPGSHHFADISVAADHACGIDGGTMIWCWGADGLGQLGDGGFTDQTTPVPLADEIGPEGFVGVLAGGEHGCALYADGSLGCWGNVSLGELGIDGHVSNDFGLSGLVPVSTPAAFRSLSAGGRTTCGVSTTARIYCWGPNDHGQTGTGAVDSATYAPSPVAGQ